MAQALLAAARRDREEVADYLETRREEWEALVEAAPGDAADILEQLAEEDVAELLVELDPGEAAEVLEEIAPELAAEMVDEVPVSELAAAITEMTGEAAADLLGELDSDIAEDVLATVSDDTEDVIRKLMVYPGDTAGGLMTTEIAYLPIGMSSGEAVERIRQLRDDYEDLSYVYVVDDAHILQGVISFRDLVFNRPGVPLDEAMVANPITVTPMTDREVVADICQRYHFLGVPVVDAHGRLLGMVTNEAVIEVVLDEASEDFAAAVGAGIEETVYTDVSQSFRMRAPWLVVNLGLALLVALVIEQQTGVISREPVLAALMPVVALLGGNGGNQSLAVMIRSLASDDVPSAQVPAILTRQLWLGLLNGLLLAVVSGALTWVLVEAEVFSSQSSAPSVALVVAIAAMANLVIATLAGSAIPLVLRRLGQDPAMASSIFLTLITDIVGFGGFLMIAAWLL